MLCGFRRFPEEAQPTLSAPHHVIRQGKASGLTSQCLSSSTTDYKVRAKKRGYGQRQVIPEEEGYGPSTTTPPEPTAIPLLDYGMDYGVTMKMEGAMPRSNTIREPLLPEHYGMRPLANSNAAARTKSFFTFYVCVYPIITKVKVRVEIEDLTKQGKDQSF